MYEKCDNQRKKNECDKEERGKQKQNERISVTISNNPKVGSFSSFNTSSSFDQLETFVNISFHSTQLTWLKKTYRKMFLFVTHFLEEFLLLSPHFESSTPSITFRRLPIPFPSLPLFSSSLTLSFLFWNISHTFSPPSFLHYFIDTLRTFCTH